MKNAAKLFWFKNNFKTSSRIWNNSIKTQKYFILETSSSSNIEETEDFCTNIPSKSAGHNNQAGYFTTDQVINDKKNQPGFHTTDGNFPDDENHQHPPTPQLSGSVSSSNQPTSSVCTFD